MYVGSDPGIVGESYIAPMPLQSAEEAINWYVENAPESVKPKMPQALLGAPGLNALFPVTAPQVGPVRGTWVLPGSNAALAAINNQLFLITIQTPATQTSQAVLKLAPVGTLLTSSGPVVMRDNGVLQNGLGGYCLIVDGTYGYYYLLSGVPYVNTFTAATQSSSILAFPGELPNGLIIANTPTLTALSGFIPRGTTVGNVDTVGLTLTMSAVATGSMIGDTITLNIPVFGRITDPGFLGADRILFIEGWLMCNQPNTRTFFTTGPTPYQILFPGLDFALKDSSTDNLVTLEEQNREAWLIGERTTEVWYNAGNSPGVTFARLPGVGPQMGCAAKHSIARCGQALIWLGRNEQGQNYVVASNQYSWTKLSTHAVDVAIASYTIVSDAIGYGYVENGHLFYVLTFPTADVTWVFDVTTKAWHKRLSYDPVAGVFHRHRSNSFMNFADMNVVGDYQSGQLYQMSRAYYTDSGAPLIALRRTPHIWSAQNRERVFFSQLQIEFNPGVGLQSGQGSNPQAMLRWSDDGGYTWTTIQSTSIGAAGQFGNRAMWRLLGKARDRVWEVSISDPVPRDIIGATLYAEAS